MTQERGVVTGVDEDSKVTVSAGGQTVSLQLDPDRVREEDWRPGRSVDLEFADDGVTVETFDLAD